MGDRVEEMYERYRSGLSLRAVGAENGISGERVRQLFENAGLPTRNSSETRASRQALRTLRSAAIKAGAEPRRKRKPADWISKKYEDEELLEILRITSRELGGILTAGAYNEFAADRRFADGRPWPSHQTHFHRFGSWRDALVAAGLPANPSSAMSGQRIFERDHCIDAVRHVRRELGHTPSLKDYEEIARRSGGALPSGATVRNRCGSWSEAVRLASAPLSEVRSD